MNRAFARGTQDIRVDVATLTGARDWCFAWESEGEFCVDYNVHYSSYWFSKQEDALIFKLKFA